MVKSMLYECDNSVMINPNLVENNNPSVNILNKENNYEDCAPEEIKENGGRSMIEFNPLYKQQYQGSQPFDLQPDHFFDGDVHELEQFEPNVDN